MCHVIMFPCSCWLNCDADSKAKSDLDILFDQILEPMASYDPICNKLEEEEEFAGDLL